MAESSQDAWSSYCALCRENFKLCQSHIVPEFLYKRSYDEKHRTPQFDSKTGRRRLVQKGHRERLLCRNCERSFNEQFETPFHRLWYERAPLTLIPEDPGPLELSGIPYRPFKLFHLSILWRASVASDAGFDVVDLELHEERIRRMLLEGDAGEPHEYPVTARALFYEGELADGVVMSPVIWPFEGTRIHTMIYGGFEWWIGVADDCPEEFLDLALMKDGTMQVEVVQWSDSDFVLDGHEPYGRSREDRPAD